MAAVAAAAPVSVDEKLDKLRAEVAKLDQIRRVPSPTPLLYALLDLAGRSLRLPFY